MAITPGTGLPGPAFQEKFGSSFVEVCGAVMSKIIFSKSLFFKPSATFFHGYHVKACTARRRFPVPDLNLVTFRPQELK